MSTPSKVILQYGRVGDLSSGQVFVISEEPIFSKHFEELSFDRMLYLLAGKIQEAGECEVWFVRADRQGSAFKLDALTVELLRSDPVAGAKTFNVLAGPPTFEKMREAEVLAPPPLRAGFDVLADAFGERVYLRVSFGDVECPGCGFYGQAKSFQCQKGCLISLPLELGERWAGVAVTDLLATGLSRFYLPRLWSPAPWITRDDLDKRYQDFVKERERATCSTP